MTALRLILGVRSAVQHASQGFQMSLSMLFETKKPSPKEWLFSLINGAKDGARTRDLRRDRATL
jgi:hypothetical protein